MEHCIVEATMQDRSNVLSPSDTVERAWIMSRPPAIKLGPKLTVSTRCTQIVRDAIQHKPCAPQCPCDARVPQPILYPQCDQIFEEHPVYRPNAKLEDFNWDKKRGLLKKGCCGM